MSHHPHIGVFDSGVGGFSIVAEIKKLFPQASYFYCCDNLNYPYGPKDEDDVIRHVNHATSALLARYPLDALVIGCNTASTVTLPIIRSRTSIPVIGVVPAIKPAAEQSQSGKIGLLATPGTIRREYTEDLIRTFAGNCEVIRVGSSRLVDMVEEKLRGLAPNIDEISAEISAFFDKSQDKKVDTVVLGCTHFPLLQPELGKAARWPVAWVDSGTAIAQRLLSILAHPEQDRPRHVNTALFTRLDGSVEELRKHFLANEGFERLEQL